MPDQTGTKKNLAYEIKCIEFVIKSKEFKGEDATFEKGLVAAYRKVLAREMPQR